MKLSRCVLYVLFQSFCVFAAPHDAPTNTPSLILEADSYRLSLSGYVRYSAFADSRQVMANDDGIFLFFPKHKVCDARGHDINRRGQTNMLALETLLHAAFEGTSDSGTTYRGIIETDLLGPGGTTGNTMSSATNLGNMRMRLAYVELTRDWWSIIAGQIWSPMHIPCCSPDTVSYNTGGPMDPYTWHPQIRFTATYNNVTFLIAAMSQLISPSLGPLGPSSLYARRALVPNFHWQVDAQIDEHQIGTGLDLLRLVPRIVTNKNIKVVESIVSLRFFAHAAIRIQQFLCNIKLIVAQNPPDLAMIGGYAVHTVDPVTDRRTYANLRNVAAWIDLIWKNDIEPGLFVGGIKNRGAGTTIIQELPGPSSTKESTLYAFAPDIDYILRVSPRIRWYKNSLVWGAELEYTRAGFGTIGPKGRVTDVSSVGNLRFFTTITYLF